VATGPSARANGRPQQLRRRKNLTSARLTPARVTAKGWGWRHAGRRAFAVRGLDLRIEPGERVLLLGASGAGKSTLISALAGVLGGEDEGEQTGELLIDGMPAEKAHGRAGLVLQDPDSQVILAKIGDDVAFGCENLGVPRDEIWRRVREALDAVGLDLPLDRSTSELSGGQKQRLALAGVLAMRPGLLLLDEPTANLDPDGVAEVRDAVAATLDRTGATFLVIEHRVEVWRGLVNRVVVLSPTGGILADGDPDVVLADNGRALADQGVWIPEFPPAVPARTRSSGAPLLAADALAIGRRTTVRSDISLELREGELLAISGRNGCGKSTLALTLGGLLEPRGGAVVAAPDLAGAAGVHPIRWKSRELLTRIGSVFQDPEHQFLAPTVRDELAVGPRALKLSPAQIDGRVDELLTRLRLDRLAEANPFTLSGGEKRRLSVGTALATRPRVLLLDEPTFGQDSRTWAELVALIAELLDEGTAAAASTHDVSFISALATGRIEL
jgi:energy-coupling factor transport system ATP-binding protein